MKKNGFTLTEMIAVIVIIGVILLITIPIMNKLLNNNKEEKYMFYVETVEKAIYAYGDHEFDMTVYDEANEGTVKQIQLRITDLINEYYLKKFNEDGVTVNDGTTFVITKQNGKVTIVQDVEGPISDSNSFSLKFEKGGSVVANCTKSSCS